MSYKRSKTPEAMQDNNRQTIISSKSNMTGRKSRRINQTNLTSHKESFI